MSSSIIVPKYFEDSNLSNEIKNIIKEKSKEIPKECKNITDTGYIYMIYNDVNDKLYIGQTELTIEHRFKQHINDAKKLIKNNPNTIKIFINDKLHKAMVKYGINKFHVCEIGTYSIGKKDLDGNDNLDNMEIYWIKVFDSVNKGYNISYGGSGNRLIPCEIKEQIIPLWNKGYSCRKIGKELNISAYTVGIYLKKQSIISSEIKRNIIIYSEIKEQILPLWNKGYNCAEIAKKLGISYGTVSKYLKKIGITNEEIEKRRKINISKKNSISMNIKEQILLLWNEGFNCAEIGKKLNISIPTVSKYLKKYDISDEDIKNRDKLTMVKFKTVNMIDKDTNKIFKTFNSIADAERFLVLINLGKKGCHSGISACCRGKIEISCSFKWEYC